MLPNSTSTASGIAQRRVQAAIESLAGKARERGVQFCVYRDGNWLVDVCVGIADIRNGQLATPETLFPVFSVTKGIAATIVHQLVEQKRLSYKTKIAEIWPEFGQHGKADITVEHALRHTAGIPELPEGMTIAEVADWRIACRAIENLTPLWPAGTRFQYHSRTFGWILGEVVQRIDGRPFTQIVREDIAGKLGVERMHVGFVNEPEGGLAYIEEPGHGILPPFRVADAGAMKLTSVPLHYQMNLREMQSACLPSTTGLMNARTIAAHYAALLPGGFCSTNLLPESRVNRATAWQTHTAPDGSVSTRGLGYEQFALPVLQKRSARGFGHGGYGGSVGFASRELGIAVGYTRNYLTPESCWEELLEIALGPE